MGIRVFLADDHPTLRVGLQALLRQTPDIEMVGEASTGFEALEEIRRLQPDVAVLDCELPGLSGPEVAAAIQEEGLPVYVLMLSAYNEERYIYASLEAGAVGYVLKSEPPEVIVQAIRRASRGEPYLSPPVALKAAAWRMGRNPGGLTRREVEVLRLVAEGLSNKEIACTLGVTVWTVNFHIGNILKKLGVASRVEAAVWAKEHSIVP